MFVHRQSVIGCAATVVSPDSAVWWTELAAERQQNTGAGSSI
jgi:hypothetical protein